MKSIIMRVTLFFILLICFSALPGYSATERRTALVIGNSGYHTGSLQNPVNDADDMAATLKRLGFDVVLKKNATHRDMEDAIRNFGDRLKRGGVGLFFYAGHGVQISGRNYLLPIGARIERDTDVKYRAVDTNMVLDEMGNAGNPMNIVILDACRDNPFGRSFRSASRGLAIVSSAPRGTLVSYSTSPGNIAADGEGRNSPYTAALLRHMTEPGQPVEQVFKKVRQTLSAQSGGSQIPWELSSLQGNFSFVPGTSHPAPEPFPDAAQPEQTRPVADESADGLELAMARLREQKEAEEQKKNEREWTFRALLADVKKYETVAGAEIDAATKSLAWRALTKRYPQWSAGARQGEVEAIIAQATDNWADSILADIAAKEGYSPLPITDPATGMEFVYVKGGCFDMGDTFPVHNVCVSDFYIGKYEVTQGQWRTVMGSNPSYFSSCGNNCPVENVSWNDVQEFIGKLNAMAGQNYYRLPTEAEWEYAARSGGKREKWAGTSKEGELGRYAWYRDNSGGKTHLVGLKRPNGLGLYDMTGNVWEWCQDWYGNKYYGVSPKNDPTGPSSGSYRVNRGGCWSHYAINVCATDRGYRTPDSRDYRLGFRLLRTK